MKRINKTQARKLYESYKPFIMVPSKCSPASPFACLILPTEVPFNDKTFEECYNEFKYYNCGYTETGMGIHFYINE